MISKQNRLARKNNLLCLYIYIYIYRYNKRYGTFTMEIYTSNTQCLSKEMQISYRLLCKSYYLVNTMRCNLTPIGWARSAKNVYLRFVIQWNNLAIALRCIDLNSSSLYQRISKAYAIYLLSTFEALESHPNEGWT